MQKRFLFAVLGIAGACAAQAQEAARVISSTPVIAQVPVQRQFCSPQPIAVAPPTSGAGSIIGAVAGGIIGSTLGGGMGQAAATALGAVGGALVGNQVEAGSRGYGTQFAQPCHTETVYENRTVGYNVSYEWGGRVHAAQMPYDPGATVFLQVSPVDARGAAPAPESNAGVVSPGGGVPILRSYEGGPLVSAPAGSGDGPHYPLAAAPAPYPYSNAYPAAGYPAPIAYPAPMMYPAPAYYGYGYGAPGYPVYGVRPYFPPVGISLNLGYSRGYGHRHGGRGRWR